MGRISLLELPNDSREKIRGKDFGQNDATMWL